jgi:acetyltransferase-like isoleucine patch superfamily enzyme
MIRKFRSYIYKICDRLFLKFWLRQLEVNQNSEKKTVVVEEHVTIYNPCNVSESKIGKYTYIAENSRISMADIGSFCSIGPNLVCGYGIHPIYGISTHPMFYSTRKQNGITLSINDKFEERRRIKIGNDVFIGANVTILDGVTIGNGAVIGAGAVVSKDIPPYAVAVGVPIKVIKYRFDEAIVAKMLEIEWWNYSFDDLREIEQNFFDVEKYLSQKQS